MAEINLLNRYPKSKRNLKGRATAKTDEHIRISRQYGFDYFDGSREYGYGGYSYDGRWGPVAEDIIEHFGLKSGDRVLDIGCAKGFLVKDLMLKCPGLECFGVDISSYAVTHCEEQVIGRLHVGNMTTLPFPDNSFDVVLCINTLHNLEIAGVHQALKEISRVTRGERGYIQVDSYRNEEEREVFLDWVLTAHTHDFPAGWQKIFEEAGYSGDYYWTLIS